MSSLLSTQTISVDEYFMQLAIKQANICIPISSAYNVGAILVKYDPNYKGNNSYQGYRIISTGYSRELPGNTHAEECALMKYKQLCEINPAIEGGWIDSLCFECEYLYLLIAIREI